MPRAKRARKTRTTRKRGERSRTKKARYSFGREVLALGACMFGCWGRLFFPAHTSGGGFIVNMIITICSALFIGRLCSQKMSVVKWAQSILILGAAFTVLFVFTRFVSAPDLSTAKLFVLLFVPGLIYITAMEVGNRMKPDWIPLVVPPIVYGSIILFRAVALFQSAPSDDKLSKTLAADIQREVLPELFQKVPDIKWFPDADSKAVRGTFRGGKIRLDPNSNACSIQLTVPLTDGPRGSLLRVGINPQIANATPAEGHSLVFLFGKGFISSLPSDTDQTMTVFCQYDQRDHKYQVVNLIQSLDWTRPENW